MKNKGQIWKALFLSGIFLYISCNTHAEGVKRDASNKYDVDTLLPSGRFIHKLGVEFRPEYVLPSNSFLRGEYADGEPVDRSYSGHLKYAFQFQPHTFVDRIYGGVYQGIGLSYFTFGDRIQIGDPFAFYLFQGGRLARLHPSLSINYEWNFGLSFGWKPYDYEYNSRNTVIGSKVNAYLNTNFYFNWMVSKQVDLTAGVTLAHFSNGNTEIPNAGLNSIGLKVGVTYNFNRKSNFLSSPMYLPPITEFPRHISYDVVLFGSWRRKGVAWGEDLIPSPDTYPVFGFNFTPLYNFTYRFRAGLSLDGVYDGSANVYTEDYIVGTEQEFFQPPFHKQIALGISARTEYVMPYFTVGIGIGTNVLHGGGDLKSIYQVVTLKIETTRNSFIHVGYTLQDFHNPNYLMLGVGYRFNNKYPTFHR